MVFPVSCTETDDRDAFDSRGFPRLFPFARFGGDGKNVHFAL